MRWVDGFGVGWDLRWVGGFGVGYWVLGGVQGGVQGGFGVGFWLLFLGF